MELAEVARKFLSCSHAGPASALSPAGWLDGDLDLHEPLVLEMWFPLPLSVIPRIRTYLRDPFLYDSIQETLVNRPDGQFCFMA
jgi:hypothetical protein